MFCPKCGSEMPEGSRFCGECGFRMEETMPGREMPGQEIPVQMMNQGYSVPPVKPEKKTWKTQWTVLIAAGVIAVGVAGGFGVKALLGSNSEKETAQEYEAEALPENEIEKTGTPENAEVTGKETQKPEGGLLGKAKKEKTEAEKEAESVGTGAATEEEPEEEEEDLPVTASLVPDAPEVDNISLFEIEVRNAVASSTISQEGLSNDPMLLFDGEEETSWQEGVAGYGIGESLEIQFDYAADIEYLSFKLGNWKNDKYYFGNAKPKTMTFIIGDFTGQVTFTGDRTTEWVKLSRPVKADKMTMIIDDVYEGTSWEDTCIAEMGIYGY